MWVFGYGSLMWDNWEVQFAAKRRVIAELHGFRRAFNKASVRNSGTQEAPGPTLNLEVNEDSVCVGVAFQFPAIIGSEVTSYLGAREGRGFCLRSLPVAIPTGQIVDAFVPIYTGSNSITGKSTAQLTQMIAIAAGTNGSCRGYLDGIYKELTSIGIDDSVVSILWNAVRAFKKGDA